MGAELIIQTDKGLISPAVEEGITCSTSRAGAPSKLSFTVLYDERNQFTEGNAVRFKWNNDKVFFGFIFKKTMTEDRKIDVVAYDQLRYLKNKETYVYENKKASDVVRMICEDFRLNAGNIEDTGYNIASRIEDGQTLFDIIDNALGETVTNTKRMYVLYDDFGSLTLRAIDNMKTNVVIDASTGESFTYESSIDDNTYNKIKLVYDNEDTKQRDVFITQDSNNMNKWGVLQYYDTIQKGENGAAKAEALLSLYNAKTRRLSITNAVGQTVVRAGSMVVVVMDLGDMKLSNYMLVESCTHEFNLDEHKMTLKLRGGEFTGE